ncbi:pyridoxamine 5'-phosphate oxidase [Catenovulum sp. 2E275]|uniref:pyridoxamine 5'-phosphate oxidase n=1 Tax=Catenovulum sp. 2E275 TaxID=2980497 RepID=UPI0021D26855|nr:pyridoxamine 5'-phosphate oxidase [Catenovulum sp. 2E275]MCU4674967.1 pyridoxamine 5'-phosphate oxidase [Catenovulum sp. 2E275]
MSIFYQVRREYDLSHLTEAELTDNPFELFEIWLEQVMKIDAIKDPTAMILATVNEQGIPSQRTVLMKSVDSSGLVFYTNKNSRKGQDLAANQQVSVLFPWLVAERQVIFSGQVEALAESENDEYFSSRPLTSQVAALVSEQSKPIASRDLLEQKYHQSLAEHQAQPVQRPPHWGGFKIKVQRVEFWQGGEHRLHDRFCYQKDKDKWIIERLQP